MALRGHVDYLIMKGHADREGGKILNPGKGTLLWRRAPRCSRSLKQCCSPLSISVSPGMPEQPIGTEGRDKKAQLDGDDSVQGPEHWASQIS